MGLIGLEVALLGVLILINAFLALAEIAIVSARRSRLEALARQGRRGARIALELQAQPTRFLSTVQTGMTLIGIVAGFVGGATIAEDVALRLRAAGWFHEWAGAVAVAGVVGVTTYLSLVVGELAPKRFALQNAERLATLVAPALRILARVTAPVVRLLSVSTDALLWLVGARRLAPQVVTEEEIRLLLAEGAEAGILHKAEHEMVANVFRLADRQVLELMTPRNEVVWLDAEAPLAKLREKALASGRFQFPVCRGALDEVIGITAINDLAGAASDAELANSLREPLFVAETTSALKLPEMFREFATHLAVVIDEHGAVQGVVTVADVLREIVGALPGGELEQRPVVRRDDGSLLIEGALPLREFKELLGVGVLPGEERKGYATAAGFVMFALGRVPVEGDHFSHNGTRIEVMDMDRHRIDKLLLVPPGPAPVPVGSDISPRD